MLRIHLLGEFRVFRNGIPVSSGEWHTRQARQLLKILLTEPNRVVPSERLIELLWPEADETAGMSLRSAINALRAVLEPDRPPHSPSRFIPRGNNGYKFVLPEDKSVWLDSHIFEQQLNIALSEADNSQAQILLVEALKLYSGEYLVEDKAESWAWAERERLRECYLRGTLCLAEIQYAENRLNEALATCRKALSAGSLSEPLYRLIMRCQAEMGDRAGALLTFERCRRVLDEQLGVDPSPQTLQMHSAILQGDFSGPLTGRSQGWQATQPRQSSKVKRVMAVTNSSSATFVGRKTELACLLQLFSRLKERETRTVALVGETGVGKSTLVSLFLERLKTTSAQILTTVCQPVEEKVAFASLTAMLGEWLHTVTTPELARLPRPMLAQLAALVPGLYSAIPDLPSIPLINAEHAYSSLMATLVEFYVALSREQPLVLIWDDVQWADESTLRLINRLANLQNVPLLLIIILRAEDLGENTVLTEIVRTLQRNNHLTTLNLARFTTEEVSEYVRLHQLENKLSIQKLQQIVQGNAFFLAEAVRVFEDEGNLLELEKDMATLVISQSEQIRDIVLARVARLPGEAVNLLEVAAVIGRPFALDLLNPELSSTDQQALNLLLSRRFLVDVTALDDTDIHLAFAHSLSVQIIYNECSPLKRSQLHQLVAENMARRYAIQPGRRAGEIAHHYRKAGLNNQFNILRYEIEAGDYARQTLSFQQALFHYRSAEQALTSLPSNVDLEQWRGRLHHGYALAYEALLDWSGVQESYRKLWDWAERQGDVRLAASSALHIVFTRSLMGYLPEAAEIGQSFLVHFEGVVAREGDDPQKSLQIILTLIRNWMVLLNPSEHIAAISEEVNQDWPACRTVNLEVGSAEVVRLFGPVQAAFILTEYGRALLLYGQLGEAEICLKTGQQVSEETNQIVSGVLATMHLSRLYQVWGKETEADYWYSTILSKVSNIPEAAWVKTWPLLSRVYYLVYQGQLIEAEHLLQQLETDLNINSHFSTHHHSLQIGWGILEQARGNFERANQLLQEAVALSPLLYLEAYILAELALAQIREQQGQPLLALPQLRSLLRFCGERGLLEFYYLVALNIVRLLLTIGQKQEATILLDKIEPSIFKAGYYQYKVHSTNLRSLLDE